jgi:peptide/nickel transport system ATP-binding protein
MSAKPPLLTVSGLTVSFPKPDGARVRVVDDASLVVESGQVLALVGESGSGKTMLGRSLLGLLPRGANCSARQVLFDGIELAHATAQTWRSVRGGRIGMIFQEPMASLNPAMTIGVQMAEALKLHHHFSNAEIHRQCCEFLTRVRVVHPERALGRFPHEFSGGTRQRIMLASVLLPKPRLLIADEPTTALDVIVQKEVLDIMVEAARQIGTAIILITHDLGLVAEYADSVVVMRGGIVVESGETQEVLAAPKHSYTRELLGSMPQPRHRSFEERHPEPLIVVDKVSITYDGRRRLFRHHPPVQAIQGVSLEVQPGETLALVGESGSGKTSLGRAMVGLTAIAGGAIRCGGVTLSPQDRDGRRQLCRRALFIYQDPYSSLDPRMRALGIVEEGLRSDKQVGAAERRSRALTALDEVGLEHFENRLPHQMSGGQRQRLSIARALVMRPEIIVADEPVAALDVTIQAQILDLLDRLKRSYRFTCVFISHDLRVVEQIADRVAILYRGELVESGRVADVFSEPSHPYTRALLAARPILIPNGAGGYRLASRPGFRDGSTIVGEESTGRKEQER